MKILYITNMYPHKDNLFSGIFVQEQIFSLKKSFNLAEKVIFINGTKSLWNYFNSIFKINFHLMNNEYELIHIHYGLSGLFILFNPFLRTPVILTLHGGDININRKGYKFKIIRLISRMVANRAAKVIVVNAEMLKFINSEISSIVIPCGINTEVFFEEKNKNNNSLKEVVIGFPSDPKRREKNYGLFKNIIDILGNEYLIRTIEFTNKSRNEVQEGLNDLDLLLMTSYSEGSPQIVKEAMCCNTPVISTNVGDVQKLFSNVENCYVVDSFVAEDFILPIKRCLKIGQSKRISNSREKIFLLGLDNKSTCKNIFETYQIVLKQKHKKTTA